MVTPKGSPPQGLSRGRSRGFETAITRSILAAGSSQVFDGTSRRAEEHFEAHGPARVNKAVSFRLGSFSRNDVILYQLALWRSLVELMGTRGLNLRNETLTHR